MYHEEEEATATVCSSLYNITAFMFYNVDTLLALA